MNENQRLLNELLLLKVQEQKKKMQEGSSSNLDEIVDITNDPLGVTFLWEILDLRILVLSVA